MIYKVWFLQDFFQHQLINTNSQMQGLSIAILLLLLEREAQEQNSSRELELKFTKWFSVLLVRFATFCSNKNLNGNKKGWGSCSIGAWSFPSLFLPVALEPCKASMTHWDFMQSLETIIIDSVASLLLILGSVPKQAETYEGET